MDGSSGTIIQGSFLNKCFYNFFSEFGSSHSEKILLSSQKPGIKASIRGLFSTYGCTGLYGVRGVSQANSTFSGCGSDERRVLRLLRVGPWGLDDWFCSDLWCLAERADGFSNPSPAPILSTKLQIVLKSL